MFQKMSNSVGDSLERCRNAFRVILEGERGEDCGIYEEEDYLVKASRYGSSSDGEAEMEPDPAIDPVEQLDYPERSELITALHKSIELSEHSDEITIDEIEEQDGDTPTFRLVLSTTGDERDISLVVSDVEKMLDAKCKFLVSKRIHDRVNGESISTVVYEVAFDDKVEESENGLGFHQKRIRSHKPKQIRQSKRCVRDNKFMRKHFRRKYFAKRKLLIGS